MLFQVRTKANDICAHAQPGRLGGFEPRTHRFDEFLNCLHLFLLGAVRPPMPAESVVGHRLGSRDGIHVVADHQSVVALESAAIHHRGTLGIKHLVLSLERTEWEELFE